MDSPQHNHHDALISLPPDLKKRIGFFLRPSDAFALASTCRTLYRDLALSVLPMKICFKSWYGSSRNHQNQGSNNDNDNNNNNNNIDDEIMIMGEDVAIAGSTTAAVGRGQRRGGSRCRRQRPAPRRGPKIPFLRGRTHSVTLTGTWSHQGWATAANRRGNTTVPLARCEFYVIAHPYLPQQQQQQQQQEEEEEMSSGPTFPSPHLRGNSNALPFDGGRVVWASPLESVSWDYNTWSRFAIHFVPRNNETYYIYTQSGPRRMMLGFSLHVSNLIAHSTIYDHYPAATATPPLPLSRNIPSQQPQPQQQPPLIRHYYQTLVQHMTSSGEEQASRVCAFYTKMLEAVARSIRMQLAKKGALDPLVEGVFSAQPHNTNTTGGGLIMVSNRNHGNNNNNNNCAATTATAAASTAGGLPRDDTTSLFVLEEIAGFLSEYAYVNQRRRSDNIEMENDGSTHSSSSAHQGGGGSNSTDSIPDWVPYCEESTKRAAKAPAHAVEEEAFELPFDEVDVDLVGATGGIDDDDENPFLYEHAYTTAEHEFLFGFGSDGDMIGKRPATTRVNSQRSGGTCLTETSKTTSRSYRRSTPRRSQTAGRLVQSCRRRLAKMLGYRRQHLDPQAATREIQSQSITGVEDTEPLTSYRTSRESLTCDNYEDLEQDWSEA